MATDSPGLIFKLISFKTSGPSLIYAKLKLRTSIEPESLPASSLSTDVSGSVSKIGRKFSMCGRILKNCTANGIMLTNVVLKEENAA